MGSLGFISSRNNVVAYDPLGNLNENCLVCLL